MKRSRRRSFSGGKRLTEAQSNAVWKELDEAHKLMNRDAVAINADEPWTSPNARQRLHFAGEHTCYKFVGYMEGALNSGVSLAKRLAARDAGVIVQSA